MRRRAVQLRPIGPPSSRGIPNDPTKNLGTPSPYTLGGWQAKKALVPVPSFSSEARRSPSSLDFRGDVEATAAPGNGDTLAGVISLRCMYTNQKIKKRKVWSDGAVKCCPKRLRVSLYRWSEVLGVTEKLLGEIYLSAPQFDAFVTGGEPELEMDEYIISLEGVIQPCDGTSPRDSDKCNAEGSVGDNSRKRKLLKPFKPPTRRTPPVSSAIPSGDASRLTGGLYQRLETPGRDNHGGMLPGRASFTGFGHVESLWESDEHDEENTWSSTSNQGDKGNIHGDSYHREEHAWERRNEAAGEMHPSITASRVSRMSDYLWKQEDHSSTRTSLPPTQDNSRGLPPAARGNAGPDHPGGGYRTDDAYCMPTTEESGGSGIARREYSQNREDDANWATFSERAYGPAERRNHGRGLDLLDCSPSGGGGEIEHEPDLEGVSDVRGPHGPENGAGEKDEGQVRSTQDILSLFGGFRSSDQPINEKIEGESSQGSCRSDMKPVSGNPDIGGSTRAVHSTGITSTSGGGGRAVEMPQGEKMALGVRASEVAGGANAAGDWSCEVCGVRGSLASLSCGVCGSPRPAPPGGDIENRAGGAEGRNGYDYDASCGAGLRSMAVSAWEEGAED